MPDEERSPAERLVDHAAIDTLADELIPALMAKLGASGLGEIEVREGTWKVRLRRPADGTIAAHPGGRRVGERGRGATGGAALGSGGAAARGVLTPVGPGRQAAGPDDGDGRATGSAGEALADEGGGGRDPFRAIATSPAVGFYQPRPGIVPGSRVRTGDPIGAVDVLGVPTEVVAPADGVVGASLVEPGESVEYGQELIWVELLSSAPATDVPIEP
jgi:biotin carboxyl carrier protein